MVSTADVLIVGGLDVFLVFGTVGVLWAILFEVNRYGRFLGFGDFGRRLAYVVRLMRFPFVFVAYVVASMFVIGCFQRASAVNCTGYATADLWSAACAASKQAYCSGPTPQYDCKTEACTLGAKTVPGCVGVLKQTPTAYIYAHGFSGTCPTAGTEGPNIETLQNGGVAPGSYCNGPCTLSPAGTTCTGPVTDRATGAVVSGGECLAQTTYSGSTCIPSPPGRPDTPNQGGDPEVCTIAGDPCVRPSDGDGDPGTASAGASSGGGGGGNDPTICTGNQCVPIPPNPAAAPGGMCNASSGGAVCVGGTSNPTPPNPGPPYPQDPPQAPELTGTATAGPIQNQHSTQYAVYGPPGQPNAGPPDPNGQCPTGTTNTGGVCVCPNNQNWRDGRCLPNGEENGDERHAGAGACGQPPTCSGDEIDCAVLQSTWQVSQQLCSEEQAPAIDINSDPLAEYGGADAFFREGDPGSSGPGNLDEGGFGLGACACPRIDPITFRGQTFEIPAPWCDTEWFSWLVMAAAYLIAAKIIFGKG